MSSTFDVAQTRARFPALNQPCVFLDNAGGSQVLDTVIDSIRDYLCKTNVQLGATYSISAASTNAYEDGYAAAAKFLNASKDEISIGISTTQLLHNLSTAFDFQPGDEMIISKLNHEANVAPWVRIAEGMGLTVKWWSAGGKKTTNPVCDLDELRTLLSDKTRIVTCPHVSNVTGTITKVKEIADLVHSFPKALLCVDGVALAPHRQVDVKALDVDFYVFSWYKVYGPHIAQLYAASRVHPQIKSLAHFFKSDLPQTLDLKLNLASTNYELVQTLPHVLDYIGPDPVTTWAQVATYEEKLQTILLDFLKSRNDVVTIYGDPSPNKDVRVPVISFTVKGMKSQMVIDEVEKCSKLGFRNGHMYAHRLLNDVCGIEDVEDGVVRISMLHYNTEDEMRQLVKVLGDIIPQ